MLTCFGVERETAARPSRSNGSTEVSALGGEALLAIKGISPGKDPSQVARTLLMEHGAEKALTTGLGISDVAWALANTREFLFIH